MVPFARAVWHHPAVNSRLCWIVCLSEANPAAFITVFSIRHHQSREVCIPTPTQTTERCLLSCPAAAVLAHSSQAKGQQLKMAVISLQLIDWLLRGRFGFIHHPYHGVSCRGFCNSVAFIPPHSSEL